jgi:phosphoglycolate phosphatase
MTLTRPDVVIFDWCDTLIDDQDVRRDAVNYALEQMGSEERWSWDEIQSKMRPTLFEPFRGMFGYEGADKAVALYRAYYYRQELKAMQGAQEMLDELHKDPNIKLAVVSNKPEKNFLEEVEKLAWRKYFVNVIGLMPDADTDKGIEGVKWSRGKPHPDPIYRDLEGTGVAAGKNVWVIGDSKNDIEAARAAGCTAILYNKEGRNTAVGSDCEPDHVVKSHDELLKLIQEHLCVQNTSHVEALKSSRQKSGKAFCGIS